MPACCLSIHRPRVRLPSVWSAIQRLVMSCERAVFVKLAAVKESAPLRKRGLGRDTSVRDTSVRVISSRRSGELLETPVEHSRLKPGRSVDITISWAVRAAPVFIWKPANETATFRPFHLMRPLSSCTMYVCHPTQPLSQPHWQSLLTSTVY